VLASLTCGTPSAKHVDVVGHETSRTAATFEASIGVREKSLCVSVVNLGEGSFITAHDSVHNALSVAEVSLTLGWMFAPAIWFPYLYRVGSMTGPSSNSQVARELIRSGVIA
jgi:hypothetical protein